MSVEERRAEAKQRNLERIKRSGVQLRFARGGGGEFLLRDVPLDNYAKSARVLNAADFKEAVNVAVRIAEAEDKGLEVEYHCFFCGKKGAPMTHHLFAEDTWSQVSGGPGGHIHEKCMLQMLGRDFVIKDIAKSQRLIRLGYEMGLRKVGA